MRLTDVSEAAHAQRRAFLERVAVHMPAEGLKGLCDVLGGQVRMQTEEKYTGNRTFWTCRWVSVPTMRGLSTCGSEAQNSGFCTVR